MSGDSDGDGDEPAPLLDDDGNPTYEFYESLQEIFARFDVGGDGVLSEVELRAFSRAAHPDGHEFSDGEISQLRACFEWVEGLTLQGFMHMYVASARQDEAGAWQELRQLGYNEQLALPQFCENAEWRMTRSASLQIYLEELVSFAAAGDCEGLVGQLAPQGAAAKERDMYVQRLQGRGGSSLAALRAALRCCASGRDVVEIEGDEERGPVSFSFWAPAESGDGTLAFTREEGGQWRAADMEGFVPAPATSPAPAAAPSAGRKHKGKRR